MEDVINHFAVEFVQTPEVFQLTICQVELMLLDNEDDDVIKVQIFDPLVVICTWLHSALSDKAMVWWV